MFYENINNSWKKQKRKTFIHNKFYLQLLLLQKSDGTQTSQMFEILCYKHHIHKVVTKLARYSVETLTIIEKGENNMLNLKLLLRKKM